MSQTTLSVEIEGRDCFDFADDVQVVGVSMHGAPLLHFIGGGAGDETVVCTGAVAWNGDLVHFVCGEVGGCNRCLQRQRGEEKEGCAQGKMCDFLAVLETEYTGRKN